MRILKKIFIFYLILWAIPLSAQNQPLLPTISSPVEEGFFTGSAEEIKAFIEKKQQEIQSVLTYLQTLLKEEISPADETTIKTAIELLNTLPWQFKKIITKLSTPSVSVNIVLPSLKGPPYNLQEFY
jgi:beta-phosphoglucomutase-like phosphatase (HAD superfamily)